MANSLRTHTHHRWRVLFAFLIPCLAACAGDAPTEPTANLTIREGVVPLEAAATDIAYDAKRNLLYLAEPSSSQLGVFSLAELAYRPPIPMGPNRPTGLDISTSNDTLIVSLPQTKAIGIIKLTVGTKVADTVRLTTDNIASRRPDVLRILANGRVLIALTFDGSGFGGQIVEYNLTTHAQRIRTDVGINSSVTEVTRMVRAPTRQSMLLLIDDSCCPLSGFVYNSQADQFSTLLPTVNRFFPTVSTTRDGSRFLIGSTLFSGTLSFLQDYAPAGYTFGPTALSLDGTIGYFATGAGVLAVRLSDGAIARTIPTPSPPTGLFALPDGRALVILTAATLHVVRLTP